MYSRVILHPTSTSLASMPPLQSGTIDKTNLFSRDAVLTKYGAKLKGPSKVGILCVKLAREAVFGPEVLKQCTVRGRRDFPALPTEEMAYLKQVMFRQFPQCWRKPAEFEPLWNQNVEAVNHCCKSLRLKCKNIVKFFVFKWSVFAHYFSKRYLDLNY